MQQQQTQQQQQNAFQQVLSQKALQRYKPAKVVTLELSRPTVTSKTHYLRNIVDTGALTIDLVESKKNYKLAYKVVARTVKLADVQTLNYIRLAIEHELIRIGQITGDQTRKKRYAENHRADPVYIQKQKDRRKKNYDANKDKYNTNRRNKRMVARLQKQAAAMAESVASVPSVLSTPEPVLMSTTTAAVPVS